MSDARNVGGRVAIIELNALVLLDHLDSGDWRATPVADAALSAFGAREDALLEVSLFLEEALSGAPPETLARYAASPEAELIEVDVELPLVHLPPRGPSETLETHRLRLPVVTLGSWLFLPSLNLTLFQKHNETPSDVVQREVPRHLRARGLAASEHITLFSPRARELVRAPLRVPRQRAPEGGAARRALKDRVRAHKADEVLASVATRLDKEELERAAPLVGREETLERLYREMSSDRRAAIALVGEAGTGKTAIVHALAALLEVPVYATSGARLIAGMSFMGQWQARMTRVLDALATSGAVLYFDDLADLFTRRGKSKIDLAGALKPYLDDERVRVIGELNPNETARCEASHVGTYHAIRKVEVGPLDVKATEAALEKRIAHLSAAEAENVPEPEVVAPLVELVSRFNGDAHFPGSAVRELEALRAWRPTGVASLGRVLDLSALYQVFAQRTGVPAFLLRQDRALKLDEVMAALGARVIGQREAIRLVAETLCVVKAGLAPRGRPLSTFLFVGPTGVGKTEVARALAGYLFGDDERMIRFDMSEYMDPWSADRLIRGIGGEEGLLTRKVRRQPFAVILLDEIEKAHPAVFDLLLQVLGEGRLTDASGKTVSFENTLIIMTSNLGARARETFVGFGDRARGAARYDAAIEANFRPEFIGRLDRVVVFEPLSEAEAAAITTLAVGRMAARPGIVARGLKLDVDDDLSASLAAAGHHPRDGARALRRHLNKHLIVPLAVHLSANSASQGATLKATRAGVELVDPVRTRRNPGIDLSTTRRIVDRYLRRERVQSLAAQRAYLAAQVNGLEVKGGGRFGHDIGRQLSELDHIERRLAALEQPRDALWALEEAELLGEAAPGDTIKRHELRRSVEDALLSLYLDAAPDPSRARLLIQNTQGDGARHWCRALVRAAPARRWQIFAHVDGEQGSATWPSARRYGPPRALNSDAAVDDLPKGTAFILSVEGPLAGAFLPLEAGLIRLHHLDRGPHALLAHRLPELRPNFDEDWTRPTPLNPQQLKTLSVSRWRSRDHYETYQYVVGRHQPIKWSDYWSQIEQVALTHLLLVEDDKTRNLAAAYAPTSAAWDQGRAS